MPSTDDASLAHWPKLVAPYSQPDARRSAWQVANTLIPYVLLWGALLWSVRVSYWLTLLIAVPTALFMMRAFILFHDCCHGSFFESWRANERLGALLGVVTLTPYYLWRHDHAVHHATAGNLDRRGVGDVTTWTVEEYLDAPRWKRIGYRLLRHPIFLLGIGAPFMFVVIHRLGVSDMGRKERQSVWLTNLALLVVIVSLGLLVGFGVLFAAALPVIVLSTSAGVWLFYVQHQFEDVYWARKERWSFLKAGLEGSSYYALPRILNWFSGSIGYHHIHHLSPKIPNYRLRECHENTPAFQVDPMTIPESLRSLHLRLVDEQNGQLVGFRGLKQREAKATVGSAG